jgi:hypothetical protein
MSGNQLNRRTVFNSRVKYLVSKRLQIVRHQDDEVKYIG